MSPQRRPSRSLVILLALAILGTTKPWSDRWGLYNALALFNPGPVT